VKHFATPDFWRRYRALPPEVRELADKNFALLRGDPHHPSLRLKKVGEFWSARVGLHYRVLDRGWRDWSGSGLVTTVNTTNFSDRSGFPATTASKIENSEF